MEENVALDSKKQKKFVKSIRGIKKLIKKNDKTSPPKKPVKDTKVKDGRVKKRRPDRGLVYLSHIPHGFYEHQMCEYFNQFGAVSNVRVIRSKRTGRSKGHAFVEFREPAVAEIVAETMNNYLMGKRLIKAACIPPEKQKRRATRKNWNTAFNPGANARLKLKKAFNTNKDDKGDLKKARKLLSNLDKTKRKLSELGINYDFFTPVDIPQTLIKVKQEKEDTISDSVGDKVKSEKKKKVKKVDTDNKDTVTDKQKVVKPKEEALKAKTADKKKETKDKKNKKENVQETVNKKEQKGKKEKLKEAGVKPMQDFIKIQQESDNDSDSPYEFDSDEYDKMLENDENNSDISSGDGSDESDGDEHLDEVESEEECVVDIPPKKAKGNSSPKVLAPVLPKQNKKQSNVREVKKTDTEDMKRKTPQNKTIGPTVPTSKPKFEKQNKQKPTKKQFKKRK